MHCVRKKTLQPFEPRALIRQIWSRHWYVVRKVQGLRTQIGAIYQGFARHVNLVFTQKTNLNNCVEWILEHVSNKDSLFPMDYSTDDTPALDTSQRVFVDGRWRVKMMFGERHLWVGMTTTRKDLTNQEQH